MFYKISQQAKLCFLGVTQMTMCDYITYTFECHYLCVAFIYVKALKSAKILMLWLLLSHLVFTRSLVNSVNIVW